MSRWFWPPPAPKAFGASRTAWVSAASALIASAFPPAASIERTTSLALPGDALYVRATAAPSVASRLAIAAPMLREPPVTSATLLASPESFRGQFFRNVRAHNFLFRFDFLFVES